MSRTTGQYDQFFATHNRWIMTSEYKHDAVALQFHIAVKLVEAGIWSRKKHEFLVVLSNGKTRV